MQIPSLNAVWVNTWHWWSADWAGVTKAVWGHDLTLPTHHFVLKVVDQRIPQINYDPDVIFPLSMGTFGQRRKIFHLKTWSTIIESLGWPDTKCLHWLSGQKLSYCSWPRQPFLDSSYRIEEARSMRGLQVSTQSPEFNPPWMTMNWMSQIPYRGLELKRDGSLPAIKFSKWTQTTQTRWLSQR